MFASLYRWYLKTFLPFEDPSHPLYSDGSGEFVPTQYDNEMLQEISDWVDDRVGTNYERRAFSKPTEYERWGSKYYRKSK